MIEVKNLVKQYGDHLAVHDLSFTVEDGQIYGFLGPNGAGKSTTMNIITGCLAATQGTVSIDGHDIYKDARAAKQCIGYLPEQPPLYPDMTPKEYLLFVAQVKGVAKAERAENVRGVMEKTGILDVQDRLIKNLSKGYKQRVGLAQAILGDPKLIILDEPTVGLDPAQIVEIRALIKSLAPAHTVIFSSHILSEVSEICSRILIISGGKLIAEDTPENLESRFVTNPVLRVSVNGTADAVSEALETLEGIENTEMQENDDGQTVDVTVTCAKDADVKAALSKALAERGCYIVRLEEGKASLEDVFMELIAQDMQAEPSADADETAEPEEVDADALLRGEITSVFDEHEAFDAPKADDNDADADVDDDADVTVMAEEPVDAQEETALRDAAEETQEEVQDDGGDL